MEDWRACSIRFAEAGRVTHAIKRRGMCWGSSSEGVLKPESEKELATGRTESANEEKIPDRMDVPRVPVAFVKRL